jgi:hypothetical protein
MKKGYLGVILTSLSIGGLVYLYLGYYKPRQEVVDEFSKGIKK